MKQSGMRSQEQDHIMEAYQWSPQADSCKEMQMF